MTRAQWGWVMLLGLAALGILAAGGWFIWSNSQPPGTPTPTVGAPTLEITRPRQPEPISTSAEPLPPTESPTSPPIQPTLTAISFTPLAGACPVTATGGLVSEMQSMMQTMPLTMTVPTGAQMAEWEALVAALAAGDVAAACERVRPFPYQIYRFTDLPFERQEFLMLREIPPVTGWGTYVFRVGEAARLVIEAPHPLADQATEIEAVEMFRQTGARALLVAGTQRCANAAFSGCLGVTISCGQQEGFRESDVAHASQTMFQAAHRALVTCGNGMTALQLHGNSLAACGDVFISNGTFFPGDRAWALGQAVSEACGGLVVDVADGNDNGCEYTGGGGPQSYTNGCGMSPMPDGCSSIAVKVLGNDQFISIEQSMAARQDFDCIVDAVRDVLGVKPEK